MMYQDEALMEEDPYLAEFKLDDIQFKDFNLDDTEQAGSRTPTNLDDPDRPEFKLDGLAGLQGSLAKLFGGGHVPCADASSTRSGDPGSCESPPSETLEWPSPRTPGHAIPVPADLDEPWSRFLCQPPGIRVFGPPPGLEAFCEASVRYDDVASLGVVTGAESNSKPTPAPAVTGWKLPAAVAEKHAPADPDLPPLPARAKQAQAPQESAQRTTLLLQNIPRKCTRAFLEKRLAEEHFMGEIDFLYLPVDLKSKCNVGHAVLNFRSEDVCKRFSEAFHKIGIKQAFPGLGGGGLTSVISAKDQGKEANVQKLQKSGLLMSMLAEMPDWLPQLFDDQGQAEEFPEQTY